MTLFRIASTLLVLGCDNSTTPDNKGDKPSECSGSPDCEDGDDSHGVTAKKDAARKPMPWEIDTISSPHVMSMPADSLELYIAQDGVYSVGKDSKRLVTIEEVTGTSGIKTYQIKSEELQGIMVPKLYDYLREEYDNTMSNLNAGADGAEDRKKIDAKRNLKPSDVDCEKRVPPDAPIIFLKVAKGTPFSIIKHVMFTGGQAQWVSFGYVYGSERGLSKPTDAFPPKSNVWAEVSTLPVISLPPPFTPYDERSWKDELCPVSHNVGLALNADKLELALRSREDEPETKSYDCQQSTCTLADFGLDTFDGQLKTWHKAVKAMGHPYRIGDSILRLRGAQPIEDLIFITASLRNIGAGVLFAGNIGSNNVSMPTPSFSTSYGVIDSAGLSSIGNPDAVENAKANVKGKVGRSHSVMEEAKGAVVYEMNEQVASRGLLSDLDLNSEYGTQVLGGGLGAKGNQMGSGGLGGIGTKGTARGSSGYGKGSKLGQIGGSPVVIGSLDRSLIDKVIKRNMNQIRYCYQRQLTKNPKLKGNITVEFTIAKDGSVSKASINKSTVNSKAVDNCVANRFKRFRFPQPKDDETVIVKYPFIFGG